MSSEVTFAEIKRLCRRKNQGSPTMKNMIAANNLRHLKISRQMPAMQGELEKYHKYLKPLSDELLKVLGQRAFVAASIRHGIITWQDPATVRERTRKFWEDEGRKLLTETEPAMDTEHAELLVEGDLEFGDQKEEIQKSKESKKRLDNAFLNHHVNKDLEAQLAIDLAKVQEEKETINHDAEGSADAQGLAKQVVPEAPEKRFAVDQKQLAAAIKKRRVCPAGKEHSQKCRKVLATTPYAIIEKQGLLHWRPAGDSDPVRILALLDKLLPDHAEYNNCVRICQGILSYSQVTGRGKKQNTTAADDDDDADFWSQAKVRRELSKAQGMLDLCPAHRSRFQSWVDASKANLTDLVQHVDVENPNNTVAKNIETFRPCHGAPGCADLKFQVLTWRGHAEGELKLGVVMEAYRCTMSNKPQSVQDGEEARKYARSVPFPGGPIHAKYCGWVSMQELELCNPSADGPVFQFHSLAPATAVRAHSTCVFYEVPEAAFKVNTVGDSHQFTFTPHSIQVFIAAQEGQALRGIAGLEDRPASIESFDMSLIFLGKPEPKGGFGEPGVAGANSFYFFLQGGGVSRVTLLYSNWPNVASRISEEGVLPRQKISKTLMMLAQACSSAKMQWNSICA